ncbi:YTH domain-containing protein [Dionaea muscipula]
MDPGMKSESSPNSGESLEDIQGFQSSHFHNMPGYKPYAAWKYGGGAGKFAREQPCFASSGYAQHPISYGQEAVTYDSLNATLGTAKSGSPAPTGLETNGLKSPKINGFSTQVACLPNRESHQPFASSTISQPNCSFHPPKQFEKVPQSIYNFESVRPMKQYRAVGDLSPTNYQKQGLIPHAAPVGSIANNRTWNGGYQLEVRGKCASSTENDVSSNLCPANYQKQGPIPHASPVGFIANNRTWNGGYQLEVRGKCASRTENDASNQLARGPRAHNRNTFSDSSPQKVEMHQTCMKRLYNLPDFQTHYQSAKFFVIKSYSEYDIHKCIKYHVWSSTPNGNKKLDAAFHDAEVKTRELGSNCPIFLFFSVNASGQFVGLAEMMGKVDFNKTMDFWQDDKWSGFFPVKWHIIKDIPNSHLRHIILENNSNRPVTYTRDTQEIELKPGLEMLKIFKNYSAKTSILEDFGFYEARAKAITKSKSAAHQMEMPSNNDRIGHFDSGEESGYKISRSGPPMSSLIDRTRKLSIT